MSSRIEVEQKFFCQNINTLENLIKSMNFKECESINETDEYFTDINSKYIKNRICLRIRKTDNKQMELTFKGKSIDFTGMYAKTENNIDIDINSYDVLKNMLFSLGFYSYCIVDKTRKEYTQIQNDIEYNIMIDKIKNVGYFVEFELLSTADNKDYLVQELNNFVKKFNNIKFEEANLPYCGFVAKYYFDLINHQYDLKTIYYNTNDNLKLNLLKQLEAKNINIIKYQAQDLKNNLLIDNNFSLQNLLYLVNWL